MKKIVLIVLILVSIFLLGCTSGPEGQTQLPNSNANYTPGAEGCAGMEIIETRDTCWINLMKENGDETICETKITSADNKDDCYDVLAFDRNESTYCLKMTNEYHQSTCLWAFAPENYSLCDKMLDSSIRDECYYDAAEDLQDKSYCSKISNSYIKSNCEGLTFSELEAETANCIMLESYGSAGDACWMSLAEEYSNETYCEKVKDALYNSACFLSVAVKEQDPSKCALVEDTITRDFCYQQIALTLKNISICENMSTPDGVAICEYPISNSN